MPPYIDVHVARDDNAARSCCDCRFLMPHCSVNPWTTVLCIELRPLRCFQARQPVQDTAPATTPPTTHQQAAAVAAAAARTACSSRGRVCLRAPVPARGFVSIPQPAHAATAVSGVWAHLHVPSQRRHPWLTALLSPPPLCRFAGPCKRLPERSAVPDRRARFQHHGCNLLSQRSVSLGMAVSCIPRLLWACFRIRNGLVQEPICAVHLLILVGSGAFAGRL